MAEEKKEAKKKRPTALKRLIQNEKRNLINRTFKSRVRTALRAAQAALKGDDAEERKKAVSAAYSMMDKGVKRGIYKKGKADRVKSRLASRA